MAKEKVNNSQDVLDSREVIERIEALESEVEDAEADEQTAGTVDDLKEELAALKALAEEAQGYSEDWRHGTALIRDTYFTEYVEELCKDVGDVPKEIPWYIVIDWEATAEHIKQDYTEVDFNGVSYWVR